MDINLPFYYWTLNERYHEEEESFNTAGKTSRLRQININRRENASVFTAGRTFLPARNSTTVRQHVHCFDVGLPPVPQHMLQNNNMLLHSL